MKQKTTNRTKLRAVFLAAIMVISVVGMSVAFTGAVAANNPAPGGIYTDFDGDIPSVVYDGQDVYLVANNSESPDELGDANYQLRQVDDFDSGAVDSSSFVEEVETDRADEFLGESAITNIDNNVDFGFTFNGSTPIIEIETENLESGNYFISGGDLESNPARSDTFELTVQSLDVDFDDNQVTDGGADSDTDLDIDSNRGTYSVNVSADGDLDEEELLEVFVDQSFADGAIIDLHMTDAVRGSVTFDGADRVLVDDERFDEDNLGAIFQAGLNELELEDDEADALNDSFNNALGTNVEIIDSGSQIQDNELFLDGFKQVNPFNAFAYNTSEDDEDEQIVLIEINDREEEVDFTDIDEGEYTFTFDVSDTESTASADISVSESDADASFDQGTYQASAGDLAHFEFELEDTDEAWIQIGDADSDFVDVLYVEIDEADEPVEITVNTRLLGNPSDSDLLDEVGTVYDVENTDEFESAMHGGISEGLPSGVALFEDDGNVFTGDFDEQFEAYLDELGIIDSDDDSKDDQLTRPLQAFDYELQLAGDDVDDAIFDADAGAGEANDQLDSAVLELTQASVGDIVTHVAPEENADDENDIAELLEIVTQRDEIAADDRLIVQVEATGLYGGLIAGPEDRDSLDVDFDRLEDGVSTDIMDNFFDVEEINFEIQADARSGNQDPLEVSFDGDDDDTYLLIGPDQEQFFLIVDTSSDSAFDNGDAPDDGESFTATFEYDADNEDDRFEFDEQSPDPFNPEEDARNYPYLPQGETLSTSAELDIEPRTVEFDNLNADDEIQAENVEDSEISGTTNIAPGSSAELRVASTDASTSFRVGESVDINEDGEISATFDFSSQEVGDEFDTRFRAEGSGVDTVSSVIVAAGDLSVDDPVDDDDADDDDVVGDDDDADDDDVVDDTDDTVDDTDDETPGFGVLVALLAILGAALLATRRQN